MEQRKSARILVIEDVAAEEFAAALEKIGEVRTAERTDQLWLALLDFDPHVIVLDIVLEGELFEDPRQAGMRILKQIKALRAPFRHIPVIVVTGLIEPEVETQCLQSGATAFLRKPVSMHILRRAVQDALQAQADANRRVRVFISSTMRDLQTERFVLRDAICDLGPIFQVEMAEDYAAQPGVPCDICRQAATQCDLFILLIGERYGDPLVDSNNSPTEDEYRAARRAAKPILVFVKKVEHREPRLEAFLTKVGDYVEGNWIKDFSSSGQLRQEVMRAVRQISPETLGK